MFADGGSPFLAIPVIRGLSGDRVKIMTDGVWPSSQALGVAGGTLSLWDPESTERVEIYHGPGATLRGVGGHRRRHQRRPDPPASPRVPRGVGTRRVEPTTRPTTVSASAHRSRSARAASRRSAGLTYEDHGDIDTAGGVLDPSTFSSWAGDLAARLLPRQPVDRRLHRPARPRRGHPQPASRAAAPCTQPKYERTFLGLTLTSFGIGPVFHGTRISFSFDNFFQTTTSRRSSATRTASRSENDTNRFDFRLQGNLYLWDCHDTWAELAHLLRAPRAHRAILCVVTEPDRLPFLPKQFTVTPQADPGVCVNGSVTYEINEWILKGLIEDEWYDGCWDFHVGARVDWHHRDDNRTGETSDDFLFGAAGGFVRQLSKCWSTYGNASFGQRQPSLDELFSITILDGVTVYPDPDLDPEQSIAGEFGIRGTRWNNWTWSADVFAPLPLRLHRPPSHRRRRRLVQLRQRPASTAPRPKARSALRPAPARGSSSSPPPG